jgi:hypothetical protein
MSFAMKGVALITGAASGVSPTLLIMPAQG